MTISKYRNDHPPLLFNNTHISKTNTHKHLGLLFHHSLSCHTHTIHLHQKVMTKINRLRSLINLVPRHALLTIHKTNILPVFDYGNIIYDNCSDYDNRMLDKSQLSAAKIILVCLKTTSPNDVLADLNLTSLNLRRQISLLCYVSKLILDMVLCPFPASSFRSFKKFVPYALGHNQNVQIPLFEKSLSCNFFFREASSLWNSLPLEIKSSASHSIFMNRLNSHYHISKKSTHHL